MSELEDKINGILGDPAQMEKIAGLAKSLMGGGDSGDAPAEKTKSAGGGLLNGLGDIGRLLPDKIGELETDDIILLLILYLLYRESGDSELLIIMGAMFLL